MLDRRVGTPDTHLKRAAGGVEVCVRDRADLQRLTRGESEMIEAAQSVEAIANLLLAANVDRVALGARRQPLERRVDPVRAAGRDDHRCSIGRGALGGSEADPRRSAQITIRSDSNCLFSMKSSFFCLW